MMRELGLAPTLSEVDRTLEDMRADIDINGLDVASDLGMDVYVLKRLEGAGEREWNAQATSFNAHYRG